MTWNDFQHYPCFFYLFQCINNLNEAIIDLDKFLQDQDEEMNAIFESEVSRLSQLAVEHRTVCNMLYLVTAVNFSTRTAGYTLAENRREEGKEKCLDLVEALRKKDDGKGNLTCYFFLWVSLLYT